MGGSDAVLAQWPQWLTTHAILDTIPLRIGVVLSDRKVILENLVYDEAGSPCIDPSLETQKGPACHETSRASFLGFYR